MLCSLTNLIDVPLMVEFDSGRDLIIHPGEKIFYDDSNEIACEHTWDLVDCGWIKDTDEEYFHRFFDGFENFIGVHNWAIEGF